LTSGIENREGEERELNEMDFIDGEGREIFCGVQERSVGCEVNAAAFALRGI